MNEETIFGEALDRRPEERAAFLDQACAGRPDLRRVVELLLAAHDKPRNILDRPGVEMESTGGIENVSFCQGSDLDSEHSSGLSDRTIGYGETSAATGPLMSDLRNDGDVARGTAVHYFGDYEIQAEIGRGGMGVVYRARQICLNRPVALKMIKVGVLADVGDLRRFQNEAEAVALLDHVGIVPVYEVGEHLGQHYFSMKLIEGRNLSDRLADYTNNPHAAVKLLIRTAEAVQHAHMRGILHRDLKPANILIDSTGAPHVTDFGLAKRVDGGDEMTATGAVLGTPAYMSPEQAAGRRGMITTATDVYGLGALLYTLLVGKPPFSGDSLIETLDEVRTRPPVALRRLNAKVPRDLELICLKCLEKNPLERYPTAEALADDLRRFAAGEPVSVRAAGVLESAAKWARRKPTLAAAYSLGLLTILLGGLGGTAAWQWRQAERSGIRAEKNRIQAVQNLMKAEVSRREALIAKADADTLREKFERAEYGRTVQVAHQEWRDHDIRHALHLLEGTKPELRGWEWDYVQKLCHSEQMTLTHPSIVRSASFSPDGSRIITASDDGRSRVFDASTGVELFRLEGQLFATYSRDGSKILTTDSAGGGAKIWDAKDGSAIRTINSGVPVWSARFSPDGSRVVTGEHENVHVWSVNTGEILSTLQVIGTLCASFSPDGSRIVTGSRDGGAYIWDATTGRRIHVLGGHEGLISCADFSPDNAQIITATQGGFVRIWDAETGKQLLKITGDSEFVASASYSRDGSRIVTAGVDRTAVVWESGHGSAVLVLRGHLDEVNSASFSPDGTRVVTASSDRTVKVWDARDSKEVVALKGREIHLSALFSGNGSHIATLGEDRGQIWDARTCSPRVSLQGWKRLGSFARGSFSPDGSRLVTGNSDEIARVWDTRNGELLSKLVGHTGVVTSASYSPDGLRIVTTSMDKTAIVWDATGGKRLLTLSRHGGIWNCASFSPDGSRIVTGGRDETANVCDAATGAWRQTFRGHLAGVNSVSFSPDGSRILTGSADSTLKIWSSETGDEILTLRGHSSRVLSASFSPDGLRIVSGSEDRTAKVWDAESGSELLTLKGHTHSVCTASLSPDASRIITAGRDGVKIWDARPAQIVVMGPRKSLIVDRNFPSDPFAEPSSISKSNLVFNGSFADPPCATGKVFHTITGWTGPEAPDAFGVTRQIDELPKIPSRLQVAFVNNFRTEQGKATNHAIAQQIAEVLHNDTTYELSAYFGWREDNRESTGCLELWAGGEVRNGEILGGTRIASTNIIMSCGEFVLGQVNYTVAPNDPHLGKRLSVRLTATPRVNEFAQTNFAQVTLTATRTSDRVAKP